MSRVGLLAPRAELEAQEERSWVTRLGGEPISGLRPRRRARVAGVLRVVTYAPAGSRTALRAELFDGTGSVELCWTGRRSVLGIEPGRRLVASGMVAQGLPERAGCTIYNPRYELLVPRRSGA
ncbi:OB-fold nucleic acid binding domain-containing protein [Salana multivorans]